MNQLRHAARFWTAPALWRNQSNLPLHKRQRTGSVQSAGARLRHGSTHLLASFLFCACLIYPCGAAPCDARGEQFIAFTHFRGFERGRGSRVGELVLTSPLIEPRIHWNELIASWNAQSPAGTYLKVEARAFYPDHATKFFILGEWSPSPTRHPRQSVANQADADGDVATDTLKLTEHAEELQVRITLGGDDLIKPDLKFLGLSLTDTNVSPPAMPPDRMAWGQTISVPERSQMAYPNGKVLCSPTTVSMLMTYWAGVLHRPDLDHDVPEVAEAVYDSQWKGTGNWPFNMAYPGSFPGIRAYVTRMSDVSELEQWIAAGLPVGLSVCYDRLRGKGPGPNGHLVVCVGFTEQGDPIINDPGTSQHVRKVFARSKLIYAWAYSHNAAYLIYPADAEVPNDRFGHWDSWTAHQRILFR